MTVFRFRARAGSAIDWLPGGSVRRAARGFPASAPRARGFPTLIPLIRKYAALGLRLISPHHYRRSSLALIEIRRPRAGNIINAFNGHIVDIRLGGIGKRVSAGQVGLPHQVRHTIYRLRKCRAIAIAIVQLLQEISGFHVSKRVAFGIIVARAAVCSLLTRAIQEMHVVQIIVHLIPHHGAGIHHTRRAGINSRACQRASAHAARIKTAGNSGGVAGIPHHAAKVVRALLTSRNVNFFH